MLRKVTLGDQQPAGLISLVAPGGLAKSLSPRPLKPGGGGARARARGRGRIWEGELSLLCSSNLSFAITYLVTDKGVDGQEILIKTGLKVDLSLETRIKHCLQ